MGLDFIRRAAPAFTKAWDRNKENLAQPTLFTRYPECRTRTVIADLSERADLTAGANVIVCVKGPELVLVSKNEGIGVIREPPADLHSAIRDAGDCALGQVTRLNPLSGTADVEIE